MVCSEMLGVIQAYVGKSGDERESWVFISAYGPGSEKSEEIRFWNVLMCMSGVGGGMNG